MFALHPARPHIYGGKAEGLMSQPKVIVVDTRNANDYERAQIVEIAEWKGKPPSTAAKWLGRAAAPLDKAMRAAFSEETIEKALAEANKLASKTLHEDADAPLPSNLEAADTEAKTSRKWAIGMAGASGASAGAAGFAGLVIDIPFTVAMALRAIRRIGAAYGYQSEGESEFAMRVLSAAAANTASEKDNALAALEDDYEGEVTNHAASRSMIAKEGAVFATRGLAAALARNLAGRKAAQAIPVVGAAIGAAASASFIDDVSTAAQRIYQERFLRDREILDSKIA